MDIAIYDLDKTITRRPTFTHFLLFFARRHRPGRLMFLPVWIVALLGYRIGLYGRKPLKQFGIALFMGRSLSRPLLNKAASEFVTNVVMNDLQPGAIEALRADREDGRRLLMATAAPEFYAKEIGARLGFDSVIATRHLVTADGNTSHKIDGENCYGAEKLKAIIQWLGAQQVDRAACHIIAYSDHASDAPLLDWVDKGYLINPSGKSQKLVASKNWQARSFLSADALPDR
jgi:phosphatidylglycerophosphatase C